MAKKTVEQIPWKQVCEKLKSDGVPGAENYSTKTLEYFRGVDPPIPIAVLAARGKAHLFVYEEVLEWLAQKRKNERKSYSQSDRVDEGNAVARKLMAQAQIEELKLAKMRGELIAVEEAKTAISEAISRARARLLGIPTKLAAQIMGCSTEAEAQELIRTQIYEALEELARGESET